ncbi:MAG: hypothetical protein WC451_01085 [Patescibacteria group bacterium]
MDVSRPEITKKNPSLIVLIIIEAVVIVFMFALAAYLAVKILYYRSMTKISDTLSGGTTIDDCPAGQQGTSARADYKIEGREKFTFGGTELNLCCATANDKTTEAKVCSDKTNNYVVYFSRINGQFVMAMQMYPQGEKRCIKSFKESGENAEVCL